jgi:hypothetical protein
MKIPAHNAGIFYCTYASLSGKKTPVSHAAFVQYLLNSQQSRGCQIEGVDSDERQNIGNSAFNGNAAFSLPLLPMTTLFFQ